MDGHKNSCSCCSKTTKHRGQNKSQTEATDTIVDKLLTLTKYKGEPVGFVINMDIVTSPYNHKKAFNRLIHYTSITERGKRRRKDVDEGFDNDDPNLLTTPRRP